MKKLYFVLIHSAFITLVLVTVSYPQYSLLQLTDNSLNDHNPRVNNKGHVVWVESQGGGDVCGNILLYDGTTITQLATNCKNDPQINDNGHVVWWGGGVYLYDGTNITQLATGSLLQINNNGLVVWQGRGNNDDNDIFLYDGINIIQITNTTYPEYEPQINNNGHVVWSGCDIPAISGCEIFLYNGTSITQITNNSYNDRYPQINDAGYVVWQGHDGSDFQVFLYDGTTITQLSTIVGELPQINNDGYVVWRGSDGSGPDIFLYDGTSTTQLSDTTSEGNDPQINDNGYVVWWGWGSGDSYSDIFLYDGTSVTQLRNSPHYNNKYPQINNGYVVWGGIESSVQPDYEIFLATLNGDIKISPSSYDFGSVDVGLSNEPQVFNILNGGLADLIIDNISLTGTNKSNFAIQNDSCSGQTIARSSHCTVEIVFTPKSSGSKSADLSVSSNDPETPIMNVPISGTGLAKLTVEKTGTGRGTVTSEDGLIDCGKDCIETYNNSIVVKLKATAATGSDFAGWSGACTVTKTCTVTTNINKMVTATFNLLPPTRPSSLTVKATSSSQIVLTWKDNSTNESGFKIESKSGACDSINTWSQIAMKGANIKTYTNAGLTPSTTYSYRVLAYNYAGNSSYSNCTSIKTALSGTPKSPTNLNATSISASQIKLVWTENSTNETSFKVYRKVGTGSWSLLATKGKDVVSHTDTTATGNTTTTIYSYYVKACNSSGCSPTTNTAIVPYRPTNLTTTSIPSNTINLKWTDKSNNETGFEIYRKYGDCSSPNPWSKIKTTGPNITSYSNTGLTSGNTYSYKVRAYYKSLANPYTYGYSFFSNCSTATAFSF